MKVERSLRQAALALPLLASVLMVGLTSVKVTDTATISAPNTSVLADKTAPRTDGKMNTNGSMVAWAG